MKKIICLLFAGTIFNNAFSQTPPTISLTQFAQGFSLPIGIANCGDSRLFIVQQRGLIRILQPNGTINSTPFLNITSLVNQSGNERGLLGMAFHPDYANNGYFYVNYTRSSDGATRISRFSVDPNNPDLALSNSEVNLLTISQPYTNHNGGQIHFGPDGYLYIGMGDGGSGGDPQNYSQTLTSLLGKMLRIDVNGSPYAIPSSNPFYGHSTTRNEIWAIGLRNPWGFSFDRCTGDLWIGDVGQDAHEEIDFEPAGHAGGLNYGWRCYEGNVTYNTTGCGNISNYTFPIYTYPHSGTNHCSVTGGYVYRGGIYGAMFGWYFFADICSGRIWATYPNGSGGWTTSVMGDFLTNQYSAFGEDYRGELYVAGIGNGRIYKISSSGCQPSAWICGNDITICEGDEATLNAIYGEGNTYQWQRNGNNINGATSHTYSTSEAGTYTVIVNNSGNCPATSNSITVTVTPPPTTSFSGLNVNYCLNHAASTLTGNPAGGSFSGNGISGNTFDPASAGAGSHDITYCYTDNNGCTGCETQTTIVSECTSINETVFGELNLFPNPAQNILTAEIYVSGKTNITISFFNASGQLVKKEQRAAGNGMNKINFDISSFAEGVYVSEIESSWGKKIKRFVVRR